MEARNTEKLKAMPTDTLNVVIQHLLADLRPAGCGVSDGDLVARFVRSRDEDALAALVERHAPMVWGVCRRVLRNPHDAEDAFQATFLVLVQKAANVPEQTVANWLYGVARQTAVRLRATAAKQRRRETQAVNVPEPPVPEVPDADLHGLDEELSRLPDHYRCVIVLCDLECLTRKEAARQLGIPEGSVASRLARAREMLGRRMVRRAVATAAVLAGSATGGATAGVPSSLVASTIEAAHLTAAGKAVAVTPSVAALTTGVTNAMFVSKMKSVVTAVLVAALCVGGAGVGLLNWPAAVALPPAVVNPPGVFTMAPVPKNIKPPIQPFAHFRFDGDAKNEGAGEDEFKLKNTKFTDNALELNGVYAPPSQLHLNGAYLAVLPTPKMKFETFSVAVRFKAEDFGDGKSHLLSGGAGTGRWFGLSRSAKGNLAVMTNTGDFHKEIEGATLEKGKWTVVACSVDVPGQRVTLALNGKTVAVLDYPKEAPLKIHLEEGKEQHLWTFTNYNSGDVFHGRVDELRLYDRALTQKELEEIPLDSTNAAADNKDKGGAGPAKGGLAALEQKLVGSWNGHGGCVGNAVFQADGTYFNYGYGPVGGIYEIGTWKIDWSELPPTLVLTPLPTEAGKDGEGTGYLLMKLNDKTLDYRWKEQQDSRTEGHQRGTELDDAGVRIKILNSAVIAYRGSEKHGAGKKFPPDLKTLVGTKMLPTEKLLLDPWGGEIRYDLAGKNNKGKKPDIWIVTKDKKTIGNWQEEK